MRTHKRALPLDGEGSGMGWWQAAAGFGAKGIVATDSALRSSSGDILPAPHPRPFPVEGKGVHLGHRAMSDVLAGIAAYKRIDVATRKAATSQDAVEALARTVSPPRGFRAALERRVEGTSRPALIAEIKKASPMSAAVPPACRSSRTAPASRATTPSSPPPATPSPCPACARISSSIPGRWPRAGRWAPTAS